MTKIRVHEYAKQVNKSSKEVIEALSKLNVSVTNHMSMLEKDTVAKLNQSFKAPTEKRGKASYSKCNTTFTSEWTTKTTAIGEKARWTKAAICYIDAESKSL